MVTLTEDEEFELLSLKRKRAAKMRGGPAPAPKPQTDPMDVISGKVAPQESTLARPGSLQPIPKLPKGFQYANDPLAPGGEGMRPIPEYQAQQEEPGNPVSRFIEKQNVRLGMLNPIAEPLQDYAAAMARNPLKTLDESAGVAAKGVEMISPMTSFSEGYQGIDQAGRALMRGDFGKAGTEALRGVTGYAGTALDLSPAGLVNKGAKFSTKRALTEFDDAMRTPAVTAPTPAGASDAGGFNWNPFKGSATPEEKAFDIILKRMDRDGLTVDDLVKTHARLKNQGGDFVETLGELGGANMRGLTQALGTVPGEAQATIVRTIQNNAEKLPSRMTRAASAATGQKAANAVSSRQALKDRIKAESGPAYDAFFASPVDAGVFQNELFPILATAEGRGAAQDALGAIRGKEARLTARLAAAKDSGARASAKRELDHVVQARVSLDQFLADPMRGGAPTPYAMDRIKRAFDNQIEAAGQGSEKARDLRETKRSWAESVTNATGGTYAEALGIWEGGKRVDTAFDMGLSALTKPTWRLQEEIAQGINGRQMSGGEIESFAMGVARHIEDLIESNDQRALTMLSKTKALKNLETAIGDKRKANRFAQSIDRLMRNREFGRRIDANSQTAQRQAAVRDATDGEEDAVTRILDSVAVSGAPPTIPGLVGSVALKPLAKVAGEAYRRVRSPGIYDEDINAALAPRMGMPLTAQPFDELVGGLRARQVKKAAPATSLADIIRGKPTGSLTGPDKGGVGSGSDIRNAVLGGGIGGAGMGMNPIDLNGDGEISQQEQLAAIIMGTAGGGALGIGAGKMLPERPRIDEAMGYGATKQFIGPQTREAAARYFAADPSRIEQPLAMIARDLNVNTRTADALRTEARGGSRPRSRPRQAAFSEMSGDALTNPAVQGGVGGAAGATFAPDIDGDGQVSVDERLQSAGLGAVGTMITGGMMRSALTGAGDMAANGVRGAVRRAPVEVTDDLIMEAAQKLGPDQFEIWKAATMGRNADGLPLTNDEIVDLINAERADATLTRENVRVQLSKIRAKGFDVPDAPNGALSDNTQKLIELSAQGVRPKDIAERLGMTKNTVGALKTRHKADIEARRAELQQAAPQASAAADLSQYSEGTRQAIELAAMDYPVSRIARTLGFEPQNVERILAQLKPAIDARKAELDTIRAMRINRSTFAGVNAKTAQLTAAQLDELEASLKAKGLQGDALRQKLYDDTYDAIGQGWYRAADGKWRFEIDDSGSMFQTPQDEFKSLRGEKGKLRDYVSHSGIEEAYPAMGNTPAQHITMTSKLQGTKGAFGPEGYMFSDEYTPYSHDQARMSTSEKAKVFGQGRSTALHEMQHEVQGLESFATGGNIDNVAADMAASQYQKLADRSQAIMNQPHVKAAQARLDELKAQWRGRRDIPPAIVDELTTIQNMPEKQELARLKAEAAAMLRKSSDWGPENLFTQDELFDGYRRLAGEVEARNVQTRRDFTPDQRRAQAPWETQDTPDDQQIVRYGSNGPQMSANAPRGGIVSKMQKSGDMAVNPSGDELRAMMRQQGNAMGGDARSRGRSLRLLLDSETGDMYAWPAEEVWHFDVARDLNLNAPTTFRATLDPGERLENVSWKDWSDKDVGSTLDKKFRQGDAAGREPADTYMDLTTEEIAADMKLRGMTGPARNMGDYPYRRKRAMEGVERDPETGSVSWKTRSGKAAKLDPQGMGGADLGLDGFNAKMSRAPDGSAAESRETFEKAFSVMEREAIRRNEPLYVITPTRNKVPPEKQALRGGDETRGRERLYLGLLQRLGPPRGYFAAIQKTGGSVEAPPRILLLRADYFNDLVAQGRMSPDDFDIFPPKRGDQPEPEWRRKIGLFGAPAAVGAGAAAAPFMGGEAEAQTVRPLPMVTDAARAASEERQIQDIILGNRQSAKASRQGITTGAARHQKLRDIINAIPQTPPVRYARSVDPEADYDYSREWDPTYAGYRGRTADGMGGRK